MLNIAIDLDDTITDTSIYFRKYLADFFNKDINYFIINNIYYINLPEELSSRREEFEKYAFSRYIFDISIKDNAKDIINTLRDLGHKIIIITARDTNTFDNPYDSTREQLDNLGITYDKIICTRDKKSACSLENIDLIIDDSITNLNSINDLVKYKILFNSNYNRSINVPFDRVDNWLELLDFINNIK